MPPHYLPPYSVPGQDDSPDRPGRYLPTQGHIAAGRDLRLLADLSAYTDCGVLTDLRFFEDERPF